MSKLKVIKKVLLAAIIILTVIFADSVFVKVAEAATSGSTTTNPTIYWNRTTSGKGHNLLRSTKYYCIELGKGLLNRYNYKKIGTIKWNSDENSSDKNSQYYRAIARIIYDGKKTIKVNGKDQVVGGYNSYSKYQVALWILLYENRETGWPYKVSKNDIEFKKGMVINPKNAWKKINSYEKAEIGSKSNWDKKVKEAYEYLYGDDTNYGKNKNGGIWKQVEIPTLYSGNNVSGPNIIERDESKQTINFENNIGTFKLSKLLSGKNSKGQDIKAKIDSIEVTFVDNKGNSETKTLEGNNTSNEFFKLSKAPNEIGTEEVTITKKDAAKDYIITKIKVNASMGASGYSVDVHTWEACYNVTKKITIGKVDANKIQRIISSDITKGQSREQSVEFNVNKTGEIEAIKEGVNGETDLKARFNLYCENTDGYVSIKDGVVNYKAKWNEQGTFESGTKISGLRTDYTYTLFEVAVEQNTENGKYYVDGSNDIEMDSVIISNLNNGQPIKPKTKEIKGKEYYYTPSFNLEQNNTITITIVNDDMRKDLKIVKKDLYSKEELDGAQMKIYAYEEKKWLQGPADDGKYTFTESIDQASIYTTGKVIENGVEKHGVIKLDLLPKMKYYIYETKAPEGYSLEAQHDPNVNDPNGFNSQTRVLLPRMKKDESEETKYFIDLNEESSEHTVVYDVANEPTGSQPLKIIKRNSENGNTIDGVTMAIYYYKNNNDKGWLSGTDKNSYNYNSNMDDSKYITQNGGMIKLSDLKEGTYYVYERAVPEGFELQYQKGAEGKPTNSAPEDWVYLGYATKQNEGIVEYQLIKKEIGCYVYNEPLINLDITKVDANDPSIKLNGAQMKIYTKNPNDDSDKGWLTLTNIPSDRTTYNGEKVIGSISIYGSDITSDNDDIKVEYNNKDPEIATIFETDENGHIYIEGLNNNREYYVYEIKAPDGYDLTKQPGFDNKNGEDPNEVIAVKPHDDPTFIGGVYVDYISQAYHYAYLTPEVDSTNRFKYKFINEPTIKGIIDIYKKDTNNEDKLNGAKMVLYWVPEGKSVEEGYWLGKRIDESGKIKLVKSKQTISGEPFETGKDVYKEGIPENEKEGRIYLPNMPMGTYYVVETEAPDGYKLTNVNDELEAPDSNTVKSFVEANNIVYLGKLVLNENKKQDGITYVTDTYYNEPTGPDDMTLEIIKYDPDMPDDMDNGLEGAKFVIYSKDKGWLKEGTDVKYTYTDDINNAKVFETGVDVEVDTAEEILGESEDTDEINTDEEKNNNQPEENDEKKGRIYITGLEIADYYVYEIEAPEGYDLTKQKGYMNKNGKEDDPNKINGKTFSEEYKLVYTGKYESNRELPFEVENEIIVSLSGRVWVDKQDTKLNTFDYVYTENTDENLEGITVKLYSNHGKWELIGETQTDAQGIYKFTDIKYWDLENAYVEFEYDNEKYVVLDSFVGEDLSINSKAKEFSMDKAELIDANLLKEGNYNPGKAITYWGNGDLLPNGKTRTEGDEIENRLPLTSYYDKDNYIIKDINLGLLEKRNPDFKVSETLAYVKIKMNGFTYTYDHESKTVPGEGNANAPTVQAARKFSQKIYASDIASNIAKSSEDLKVYAVYKVNVENLERENFDRIYSERRLFLNSLTNYFNININDYCYELSEDNSDDEHYKQFINWKKDENFDNLAVYQLNNEADVFKDGIESGKTISTYIQFKLTDSRIREILNRDIEYHDVDTIVYAKGYHEYQRTDNLWKHTIKPADRKFNGVKGDYPSTSEDGKYYYTHKSIDRTKEGDQITVTFKLYETERVISGTVFEDMRLNGNDNKGNDRSKENIGNGIIDEGENNRAQGIKVELFNADGIAATIYPQKKVNNKTITETTPNAETTTNANGEYQFNGVVPGYYYIKFTYGNNDNNKFSDGTIIKSSDYKSTIIYTDENGNSVIKSAKEAKTDKEKKDNARWYKTLGNTEYSTAVDDLEDRKSDTHTYSFDNDITNKDIHALTPVIGITVENTKDDSFFVKDENDTSSLPGKYEYKGFNLGLIKQSHKVDIEKSIAHLDVATQMGTKLFSGSPSIGESNYVTYETEKDTTYSTAIKIQYKIKITNNSLKDYIEDEDDPNYGHYYRYGEIPNNPEDHEKTIKVESVYDFLDEKYINDNKVKIDNISEGKVMEENPVEYEGSVSNYKNKKYLKITEWDALKAEESDSIEYTLTDLLANDKNNGTTYTNTAQVAKLAVDKLTTIESNFSWNNSEAMLAIFPDTGENRSYTYLIVGVVAFATLAIGFVLIKKKVLN